MVLADSSYPLLNLFWTMFIFFLWVIWIWMMIIILTDVFRRRDISGWVKAAWSVFIITGVMLGSRLDSHALGCSTRRAGSRRRTRCRLDPYAVHRAAIARPALVA